MLDDKYRIEHLLAAGGMGEVYVGTHIKLRKRVAIKVLNPALSSPAMVERFHREAITASQIGHEGIAQVTDLGTSRTGEPFLVMEYLEGESLASRLKTSGPLPIDVACELGCSILAPLAAAHSAGIVHRDLKPDNVFLVRQSRGEMIKLLDFGISRSQGLDGEFRLTTTGLVLGTPYYMSPEQARGDTAIGTAADMYAFGVMLYEMLIGTVPLQGDNYNQLMYRVMTGDYTAPRVKRPELPVELEQVIVQLMALEPEHRPQTAAGLEQVLLAFCRPTYRDHQIERISGPALPFKQSSQSIAPPGTDRTVVATPAALTEAPRTSRTWMAIVAVVVVLGGVIGALAWTSSTDDAAPHAAAPSTPAPEPAAPKPAPAPAAPKLAPAPAPTPSITLQFVVEPTAAAIRVDGKALDNSELTVLKDAAPHELAITAPGYAPYRAPLAFDQSQRLVITLQRTKTKPGTTTKPGRPGNDRIDSESPYK